MDSRSVLGYLKQLCIDIDEGRPLRRFDWKRAVGPLAVPAALAFTLGTPGCLEPVEPTPEYAAPFEICDDGEDNDFDDAIDCDDADCVDECMVALYMAPMPEYCDDGEDNDGDGDIDCDDEDCETHHLCAVALYMAPMDEVCDDGVDNDLDGLTDCADDDCDDSELCAVAEYAAPFE